MDRDRDRELRSSRSHRYEDGEVKMYGAGESWRPFNNNRSPRRTRSPHSHHDRPTVPPRSPRPIRSPLGTSDSYIPPRSPRCRSRSNDRYRRDRSRGDPRDRSRDRGGWRGRDRSRSPIHSRRFSPRRNIPRRISRSPPPKLDDRIDSRGRLPHRRDWGRDRDWDRERDRLPLRDRDRDSERDIPPYSGGRDGPRDLIRDRNWDRTRPRDRDREDPRYDTLPPIQGSSLHHRRSRSPPKLSERPPVRNRSPRPMMSPNGPFRGRSRSPFGRGGRITATYRPRTPRGIKQENNVNGFNPNRSPPRPQSSGSGRSHRSSGERPIRSPVVSTPTQNPPVPERTPQQPKPTVNNTPQDIPMRSPPRGPSNFRSSVSGPPLRPPPPVRDQSPHHHNSLPNRDMPPTTPPVGPRGYVPPMRGGYGPRHRPSWGPPLSRHSISGSPHTGPHPPLIPTGPRGSFSNPSPSAPRPPNGPKISIAQMQLSSLTLVIPGGRMDPMRSCIELLGVTRDLEAPMRKLKEDEEKCREELKVKMEKLRKNMTVWEKMRREVAACGIRTDEAERSLERLADGEGSGVAF